MGSLFFDLKDKEMGGEYKIDGDLNVTRLILILCNKLFAPPKFTASCINYIYCRLLQLTVALHKNGFSHNSTESFPLRFRIFALILKIME